MSLHPAEIAVLVAGAALFGLAFLVARRGRWTAAVLLVALAGGVLRAHAASDRFLHPWDERYHMVVAKHLLAHPLTPMLYVDPVLPYDYRHWIGNHVWLHKPPFTLWLMALGMALFGASEAAARIPSVLLSTAAILWTWGIGRRLFDERVALLAAGFQAINGHLMDLAGGRTPTDHPDAVITALIPLGVWLAVLHRDRWEERGRGRLLLLAIGAVTGLALLTKWLVSMLIPAVWLALCWRRDRVRRLAGQLAVILLVAAALYLPWTVYTWARFPREAAWEGFYNVRHIYQGLEAHDAPPWYYLLRLKRSFGEMVYLPLVWLLARTLRRRDPRQDLPIAVWFLLPLSLFSFMATKMPAYILVAASAVFLMEAAFWWWLWDRRQGTAGGPAAHTAAGWLVVAILALMLVVPIRLGLERLKVFGEYDRNPVWARNLRQMSRQVGGGRTVVFNVAHPVEAMFYMPHSVYDGVPTPAGVRILRHRGYRVVVWDRGHLPAWLVNDPRVEILSPR